MSHAEVVAPVVPTQMRAMVLHAPRDLRLESRLVPVPAPGEVLVQVDVVGVCGSDIHYFEEGRSGSSVVSAPTVLGHEFGGRIAAVGAGVDRNIGERISVEPGIQCGRCAACVSGNYNHCTDMYFLGAAPTNGALQEFLIVPADHAFALPEGLGAEAAAIVEPLSVAIHGISRARLVSGDSVLIVGAGPIGVLCAIVAKDAGAEEVSVVDPDSGRRSLAAQLTGARLFAPDELTAMRESADVVLECSGSSAGLASAMESVAINGRIVVLGVGVDRLDVGMNLVQESEVTITGSHRYHDTWPPAIEMLSRGLVDVDKFITHRFALADTEEAILAPRTHSDVLKVAIHVSDDSDSALGSP